MNVRQARKHWTQAFAQAGLPDPLVDVDLLLEAVLGIPRLELVIHADRFLSPAEMDRLAALTSRRLQREPLQYLLGQWPFLDLQLEVGPAVLIPRPETEDWLDGLLHGLLRARFGVDPVLRFADIGTGSGAIGLALATRWPRATGILVDVSPAALAVARRNVGRYPPTVTRLQLVRGDLTAALASCAFDLVVANPPYVDQADLAGLMPEVRDQEPRLALDGGRGGLEVIARLLADAGRVLRPGGLLALEHGHGQRAAIAALDSPGLVGRGAIDDAAGRERCLVWECGRKPA